MSVTPLLRPDERPFLDAPPEVVASLGGLHPTMQQWRAISHPMSPGVVVAGAGSGKTAVMAARVVYLGLVASGRLEAGHRGAMPSRILCLTFTNKAAEELSRRVLAAAEGLGLQEGEEPTVLTYHAFAARLLDDYGLRMGLEPGQMLLSEAQRWQLMASLLADAEFEAWEVRSDYIVGEALKLADQLANHLVTPDAVMARDRRMAESDEFRKEREERIRTAVLKRIELCGLVEAYLEAKAERKAIDYGDQIALAVQLVDEHPEIADEFRERFPAVLLDEYQDTNIAQARLLGSLFGPGHPVLAVGDPDQNIYAWRGASLRNILLFPDEFGTEELQAERRPLYVNFRSGSRILDVANEVIGKVPSERRAEDKELRPHPDRGSGEVEAFVATHDRAEAQAIARLITERRAQGGLRWQDFAILCRKRRLFGPIAEVLREAEIPVEVVDLGGLLIIPEVVDVVSWLRLLDDPSRNVALARILMGPRWRIGYRDMRVLAQWSMRKNRELEGSMPGEDDMPGDVAFALVESLDHLDDQDMEGLSPEARERLKEFRVLLEEMRAEAATGALGDLVEAVIDRSGLWRELEAAPGEAAIGARRNLLNLVQHVAAFSPVEGEATLSTLVTYLDTAEATEDDLEPAQPSDADTVKLLTIHKAKGLEWPVVFVPGLAEHQGWASSLFPDTSRGPNPLTQPATLPFELRGDADVLPEYTGDLKQFKRDLRDRGEEEERRLCYVALTRARDALIVSCAHWYEGPSDPFHPGRFYLEVSKHPAPRVLFQDEQPEGNPVIAARAERAARWPLPARPSDVDAMFEEGWHRAAVETVDRPEAVDRRVAGLSASDGARFRQRLSGHLERAGLIEERTRAGDPLVVPATLSVTGLIAYETCPKLFYWSNVRPLPRSPNPAARRGSEIHRWIELQTRGQTTLIELDEPPDLSTEERMAEVPPEERLRQAFRASRFADKVPLYAERPFILYLDGMVVRGRIDAVFGEPDGPWEIVDYKTGRVPSEDDPLLGLQLDVYALACVEIWKKRPEDLMLTYFYLSEGKEVSRRADDLAGARDRIRRTLQGIVEGRFEPTPGEQCRWCDFLSFCDAGRAYVAQERSSGS
jgi:DNA helicase II / ATP-dependent DNA helicase PcrA